MKFMQVSLAVVAFNGATAANLRKDSERDLQTVYYPRYTGDYSTGFCSTTNKFANGGSPSSTELACCKSYFPDQQSGMCLSMLENPPTVSPTPDGGPDIWYSNYASFEIGKCINKAPAPIGRTTYESQLECCKGYYGTQESGYCLTQLPPDERPTVSPTPEGGPDIWYSNYASFEIGKCINTAPAPIGRTTYESQLECCKGYYGSQISGYCLTQLPPDERPTVSPTPEGGPDIWYANFDASWENGHCINKAPAPIGRNTYDSELECCKGAYNGQESGYCLTQLPPDERPTVSPTPEGGPDIWYADYDLDWADGKCINKAPAPNGRNTYDSQLECCKAQYGTQESGACIQDLPNDERPTVSPTPEGGPDIWYANYDVPWEEGYCINKAPAPNGRNTYDSMLECCKGFYASQLSGYCLTQLPNDERPTVSPTPEGGPDIWYANYNVAWEKGHCINKAPAPIGRNTYDSQLECCKAQYGTQLSGYCLTQLDPNERPTSSPTGGDMPFFPIWSGWETGHCDNAPSKLTGGNTYFYDTQEECCDAWFYNQASGACMQFDPTFGTRSPTQAPVQ